VGSAAGLTVQRGRYGLIGRARPHPRRFQGVAAQNSKARMGYAVKKWRTLTAQQRIDWQTYADLFTWTNRLGESYTGTGYLAFCSVNFPQYFSAFAETPRAFRADPPAYAIPVMPAALAASYDGPTGTVTLTSSDLNTDADTTLELFASPFVSAGRGSYFGPYSYSQSIKGGEPFPIDITSALNKRFGDLSEFPAVQRLFFRVVATNEGRPAAPAAILTILGTGG